MDVAVLKFGGSSLATLPLLEKVADKLKRRAKKSSLAIVLSAMGTETDRLTTLAYQITAQPRRRELDMLLSTGEIMSISLMSLALQKRKVDCIAYTGFQAGIITDTNYSRARILHIGTEKIRQHLQTGKVVLIAGYQGVGENNEITTLGRGGSDTTAVALSAALKVPTCEIYTDVEGIFTANPDIVPQAKKLKQVSYEEMLELASVGATVLHPRAVELAKVYELNILVKAAHKKKEGTMVTKSHHIEKEEVVTGIATEKDVVKISVVGLPDRPGIAAKLFELIAEEQINVDQISQGGAGGEFNDISFTVEKQAAQKAYTLTKEVSQHLGCKWVRLQDGLAKVSVVGAGMITHSGVAAKIFQTLGKAKINIEMISTSEIRVSCVVQEAQAKKATRALHRVFFGDRKR